MLQIMRTRISARSTRPPRRAAPAGSRRRQASAHSGVRSDQRSAILEAAERLCGERGLEAVSVRDIAADARVNLASINYYFGSRQNLLLTIFNERIAEIDTERDAMLAPILAHPDPKLRD